MTTKSSSGEEGQKGPLWRRVLSPRQHWDDKDEFLDGLYWMRQIVSISLGVVWGVLQLAGFIAMAMYIIISSVIVFGYTLLYQNVDAEEVGGAWEVLKEGFMSSYALFLITWIIFYTAFTVG